MTRKTRRGFTLIELMVVMGILAVLAAITWPLSSMVVQRQREQDLKHALVQIRDAIDAYQAARTSGAIPGVPGASLYPTSLDALTQPVLDARDATRGQVLRFLRRVPRDPFALPSVPDSQAWGLRSFLSEASDPKPGVDVYDVYSLSPAKALDGTFLRDW